MSSKIKFSDDTPEFVKDWSRWSMEQLIPDWHVTVTMVDEIEDDEDGDCPGYVSVYSENLKADILYKRNAFTNDEDGWNVVVHEFAHAFVGNMSSCAKNLITSKAVLKTAWMSYDDAEERLVVRLSRILVQLRLGQIKSGE